MGWLSVFHDCRERGKFTLKNSYVRSIVSEAVFRGGHVEVGFQ